MNDAELAGTLRIKLQKVERERNQLMAEVGRLQEVAVGKELANAGLRTDIEQLRAELVSALAERDAAQEREEAADFLRNEAMRVADALRVEKQQLEKQIKEWEQRFFRKEGERFALERRTERLQEALRQILDVVLSPSADSVRLVNAREIARAALAAGGEQP